MICRNGTQAQHVSQCKSVCDHSRDLHLLIVLAYQYLYFLVIVQTLTQRIVYKFIVNISGVHKCTLSCMCMNVTSTCLNIL